MKKFQIVIFILTVIATLEFICLCKLHSDIKNHKCEVPVSAETITDDNVKLLVEQIVEPVPEWKYTSLGEYRLTAYCSCEKCCDEWAINRPVDENGKPIVYTADMSIAKQGVTIAADTNVLPFGTVVLIDGHEYTVQDRGGAIKGNRIDVYFESHEEALQFGVQYKEVFVKETNQ